MAPAASSRLGPAGGTVKWPVGIGASSAVDVTRRIAATNGSIGYLAASTAPSSHLNVAAIRNAAGRYVLPNPPNVRAAAAPPRPVTADGVQIVDPPKRQRIAYPVAEFTYALMSNPNPKAELLKVFLTYCVDTEGAYGKPLQFSPLPAWLRKQDLSVIGALTSQ